MELAMPNPGSKSRDVRNCVMTPALVNAELGIAGPTIP
jgi:hypothetical protein